MLNTIPLNNHYVHYSTGLLGRKEFEVMLFEKIGKDIRSFNLSGWEKEDYEDFISWLFPRICKAIDTYRETGSSFEAYVGTLARLSAKEYHNRKMRDLVNETVAWGVGVTEMFTSESAPEYNEGQECPIEEKTDEKTGIVKNPRQLLILVLKCCNSVSADFLERVSPRLGIETDVLDDMINCLKNDSVRRIKKIELMREKINRLFCRCMVYEKNLLSVTDETAVQQLKERLERGRNRLARMRMKLSKMRSDPSNSRIARLLGISKGTVDSALHSLKTQWNNNRNKIILN